MNYKRKKSRRDVRDTLATAHRWRGNSANRFAPGQEPVAEESTLTLPSPKCRKRFVLQARARTESLLPGHPWNCGFRDWSSWGKRFLLHRDADKALAMATRQHGPRLDFRIVETF